MLYFLFLILQLLFYRSNRLILINIESTLHRQLSILEIVCLGIKPKSNPHVIGIVVQQLTVEKTHLCYAVHVDLFSQKTLLIQHNTPKVLDLLRIYFFAIDSAGYSLGLIKSISYLLPQDCC